MYIFFKGLVNSLSKSYIPKLLILAYVPTFVIIIFTIININDKFKNLDEVKELQNRSYKIITQFYELNYLQEERLFSLIYNLNKNENNRVNLINKRSVSFEYLDFLESDSLKRLEKIRKDILLDKFDSTYINNFYTDLIHKFINSVVYEHRNKTNKKEFTHLLDSFELIFKLSENYYYQLTLLLSKKSDDLISLEISKTKEQIELLKKYSIPNLPYELKKLFENMLNNENTKLLEDYINQRKNSIKKDLTIEELLVLSNKLNIEFFILNNFTASNIEDISKKFYDSELDKVIVTTLLSFIIILFLQIFGLRLKNLIIRNINKNMKEISDKNIEIEELHKYIDEYIIVSSTNLEGKIISASKAFCDISEFKESELLGQSHNIVRHPDVDKKLFEEVWNTIQSGKVWTGEIKNQTKNKGVYWTKSTIGPTYDSNKNIIGYTSIREDITQQKYAEYLNLQVSNLLDNANNGFLSFNENMKIKEGYSKISLEILSQKSLTNKNISDVLFPNDIEKQEIFKLGMENIIVADNDLSKEILISLLPEENKINEKIFSIKYKILKDNEFMVILEDITEKLSLMEKIEYENRIQKMIVAIATRKNEFIELKNNFYDFLVDIKTTSILEHSIEENFSNITKSLHTFKGLFAQEELVNTTQALHNIESKIIKMNKNNQLSNEELEYILKNNYLEKEFNKDLDLISKILGIDFLEPLKLIKLDANKFKEYELKVIELLDNKKENITDLKNLLKEFLDLNQKSLKTFLNIYPQRVENIAQRLNKKINPVKIIGDEKITVRSSYEDFIKNLVHVFRNMVDHGIESSKDRVNLNKYEKATIVCQFRIMENGYIELVISDDGRGINPEFIKTKALEKGIFTEYELENMRDNEVINLIFQDNFSTKEQTDIFSGRGIGLSSVMYQIEKIGGTVSVQSEINIGTKFIFSFPAQVNSIFKEKTTFSLSKVLLDKTKIFLLENLNIEIKNEEEIDSFNFKKYYSCIKLSNQNNEVFVLISFNQTLLDKILKIFIQSELTLEQKSEMYQGIGDETLNTILGNCIKSLPNTYDNIELSIPISLDKNIISSFMKDNEFSSFLIKTNFGDLNSLIISINK